MQKLGRSSYLRGIHEPRAFAEAYRDIFRARSLCTARTSQIQSTSGICEQDNARGAAAPPASEAFKWILRWRGQNQRLTLSKLRKMKPLLSAPIAAEADAQAHRASAGLCLAACCLWHTDEAAELAPAQLSALRAETEAYVAKVDLQFELYFRFLETLLSDLSVPQLMLTVPPLEHLLDTGRVKSSGSGLWLEFAVASGQSIQMIACYGRRSSQDGPIKTVAESRVVEARTSTAFASRQASEK